MRPLVMVALAMLAAVGCTQKAGPPKAELTERQRDSLIGASGLSGGAVVQRALAASDSMAARAAREGAAVERAGDEAPGAPAPK